MLPSLPKSAPSTEPLQPLDVPVLPSGDSSRYSRQVLFPPIGARGQHLLASAQVAIVGCGATGAATASLLARAGVGTLTLIDRDFVETSNLQRQILFDEADARDATPKAIAAANKIALFNSGVTVHPHVSDLTPGNAEALLAPAHLILDGTDNFETRFLLNDLAVATARPWIYAAALGSYAATMNILPAGPHRSACLACIFPAAPTGTIDTCDTGGILATAVNFAASLQATEALKFLTHQPEAMRRSLLSYDLWTGERSELHTGTPDPGCRVCGQHRFDHLHGAHRPHITLCGRNSVQIHEHQRSVDLPGLARSLSAHPDLTDLQANELLLRFRRGPHTLTLFRDGRAIIQGTTDTAVARSLYSRFFGT